MIKKGISNKYKFQQNDQLGQGVYAVVYRAISINNNQYVALKKYRKNFCNQYFQNAIVKQKILREVNNLKILKHENIIGFIDFIELKQTQQLYLITEYCNQGSLQSLISKERMSQFQVFEIFTQIIEGMVYIHEKNLIHRDIIPQNIFIHNNNVKIGDFGLSKLIENNIYLTPETGSLYYMAPNVLNKNDYTNKCDVWSFGMIIYEILTGHQLCQRNMQKLVETHNQIKDSKFRLKQKGYHAIFQILEKIITYEQKERLSFKEIQQEIIQKFQNARQQIKLKQKEFKKLNFLYNSAVLYQIPHYLFCINKQYKIKINDMCKLGIMFLCASIGILELENANSQIKNYANKYNLQIKLNKQLKDLVTKIDEELKRNKKIKRSTVEKIMNIEDFAYSEKFWEYITRYYLNQDYKIQTLQFYIQQLNKFMFMVEKEKEIVQILSNEDKLHLEELIQVKKIKELFKFQEYENPNFLHQFHDAELRFFTKYIPKFQRK